MDEGPFVIQVPRVLVMGSEGIACNALKKVAKDNFRLDQNYWNYSRQNESLECLPWSSSSRSQSLQHDVGSAYD